MTNEIRLEYNLVLDDPILKLITLFNGVILFIYVFLFFYHTSIFKTFSYLSLPICPLINLLLVNAFKGELIIFNGGGVYTERSFYFFKKSYNFEHVDRQIEKAFYRINIKNSAGKVIPTRFIYKNGTQEVYYKQITGTLGF